MFLWLLYFHILFQNILSSCPFWESEGRSQDMLNRTKNIKFIPEYLRILQHSSHILINPHERKLNWSHIFFIPSPIMFPLFSPYEMMTIDYRVVLCSYPKQRLSKKRMGRGLNTRKQSTPNQVDWQYQPLKCQVLEGEGSS